MAALAVGKPPVRGLRQGTAQWLRPKLRVRVQHLKAKGPLIFPLFVNRSDGMAEMATIEMQDPRCLPQWRCRHSSPVARGWAADMIAKQAAPSL